MVHISNSKEKLKHGCELYKGPMAHVSKKLKVQIAIKAHIKGSKWEIVLNQNEFYKCMDETRNWVGS